MPSSSDLPASFLEELRRRLPLSVLIGETVPLAAAGRDRRGRCPFHDDRSSSFWVDDDDGFYHCFGCSAHGDAIRWMIDGRGLAFEDGVRKLAEAAGMEAPEMDGHDLGGGAERDAPAAGKTEGGRIMDGETLMDMLIEVGREPRSYGGRALHGRRCVAVEIANTGELFGLGADLASVAGRGDAGATDRRRLPSPRIDTLGLGAIAYWPDADWPDA